MDFNEEGGGGRSQSFSTKENLALKEKLFNFLILIIPLC